MQIAYASPIAAAITQTGHFVPFSLAFAFLFAQNLHAQETSDSVFAHNLLVEKTISEAKTCLEQNDNRKAVNIMERHLGIINGNKSYLDTLRLAYTALVRELEGTELSFERATYLRRLSFLDPSFRQDLAKPAKSAAEKSEIIGTGKSWSKSDGNIPEIQAGIIQLSATPMSIPNTNILARGKIDDQIRTFNFNPFAWANSQQKHEAEIQISKAESAFARGEFGTADSLYAFAWQTDPSLDSDARERWAYSKLHNISQKPAEVASSLETLKELDAILAMAPRLKPQVEGLKATIGRTSNGPTITTDLTHHETNGWTTTATPSFRVHHHLDRKTGEKLARLLESTRTCQIERWFGNGYEPWNPPCDVVIHDTAAIYSSATGVPGTSPGHSTIKVEGGRVVQRRIDLHADDPNMSIGVLPHEATHIVLAGRFGAHLVPRWADEGMAVLSEPAERISSHTNDLTRLSAQTGIFPIKSLMSQQDYPEARLMGTFYAQSVSVVNHMTKMKGPRVFALFINDGLNHGYDLALRNHYQMNWDQLESSWRQQTIQQNQKITAYR